MSNHLSLKACLVGIAFSAATSASIGGANRAETTASAVIPAASPVRRVELERVVISYRREAAAAR
jgi:hypothetical protein